MTDTTDENLYVLLDGNHNIKMFCFDNVKKCKIKQR